MHSMAKFHYTTITINKIGVACLKKKIYIIILHCVCVSFCSLPRRSIVFLACVSYSMHLFPPGIMYSCFYQSVRDAGCLRVVKFSELAQ